MAKDLSGPWLAPLDDSFDGRAYYAAKSESDGRKRYLFGWNPTKIDNSDFGEWEWGGNLVAHEIYQQTDNSLGVRAPESIRSHYSAMVSRAGPITLNREDGFANIRLNEQSEGAYRIHAKVRFDDKATKLGIQLRYNESADESYVYALEPSNDRLSFGEFRQPTGFERADAS